MAPRRVARKKARNLELNDDDLDPMDLLVSDESDVANTEDSEFDDFIEEDGVEAAENARGLVKDAVPTNSPNRTKYNDDTSLERELWNIRQAIDGFGSQTMSAKWGGDENPFRKGLKNREPIKIVASLAVAKDASCDLCDLQRTLSYVIINHKTGEVGLIGCNCKARMESILEMQDRLTKKNIGGKAYNAAWERWEKDSRWKKK